MTFMQVIGMVPVLFAGMPAGRPVRVLVFAMFLVIVHLLLPDVRSCSPCAMQFPLTLEARHTGEEKYASVSQSRTSSSTSLGSRRSTEYALRTPEPW